MEAEWSRVEELFQAARAQPPSQRFAFLSRACSDEPGLRSEVESLLRAADDSFLEGSPLSSLQKALPSLAPGARLGHFEIIRTLGRGGMGEVYRARDLQLRREVALKILPPLVAADPGRLARFEREARAASALNHPNIVSVFEAACSDGHSWIASELVAGETLAEVIARGPIPARKLIEIASQCAAGLAAAHAIGIIHRDLKPANLMLARDGRLKILDFGLAKRSDLARQEPQHLAHTLSMTQSGIAMGTPGYMSPEQIRGESVDARSDLFSFGVILYEMACGRRAFEGDSSIAVMNATLSNEPAELPASVPPLLSRIVRRCLEKDPARRFQSAADLEFALETSGDWTTPPAVAAFRGHRYKSSIVLASAALLAAGAFWLGSIHPAPSTENYTLRQITFDRGLTADPAISPDGRFVAFASDRAGGGNLDIWTKQIDGGDPVPLTHDPANEYDPAFSPDGARIAFTSERDGGGIYTLPAFGGESSLLVPQGSHPRFSPDGRYLLYVTGMPSQRVGSESAGNRIFALPLTGGSAVELAKGCTVVASTPVWSPDGARVIFPAMCEGRWDLYASDPAGKKLQSTGWREYLARFHLGEGWNSGGDLAGWLDHPVRLLGHLRDGAADYLVALSALPDGAPGGGNPQRITFGTGAEMQASVATNGRIAVGGLTYESHVWGLPIDDSGRPTGSVRQLTTDLPNETLPMISDNGEHLVYLSTKSVPSQLYGKDLAGGRLRRLSQDTVPVKMAAAISPDGSEVLYTGISHDHASAIYAVPFAGGVPQKLPLLNAGGSASDWARNGNAILTLIEDPNHDFIEPHFSQDARWFTFNTLENGRSRVYIAPFRWEPIPRSDWRAITPETNWSDKPRFSRDGSSLLFTSDRDGFRCIWAQRLTPDMRPDGQPVAIFHSHGSQFSIRNGSLSDESMSIGKGWLVFDQTELRGNIWTLDPADTWADRASSAYARTTK
jgi:serine/threonine protein kinase/Tol biopolymer transport system component